MSVPLEDYALIGDTHTAALVSKNGSIDWLCLPRFDSPACFSALLGDESNGFWKISPKSKDVTIKRRYRGNSLILETEYETHSGIVRVIDFMAIRDKHPEVVRLVEGVKGRVQMQMELVVRMDYGSQIPWVKSVDGSLNMIAGPDGLSLWSYVETEGKDKKTFAHFSISEGQYRPFELVWYPSYEAPPRPLDARFAVEDTQKWWEDWAKKSEYKGEYKDQVMRSLLTLKALTYKPTGGIVAAPTTSLPEQLGGVRNWDYRYCWLRDATFTLLSFISAGYDEEASAWREWLLRAVAGDPEEMQIMYGVGGERSLREYEIEWLGGYESSKPVRIGNAAYDQFQLDVYGEVIDAIFQARRTNMAPDPSAWELEKTIIGFLETAWQQPDNGIWEVRGSRKHFTHSKVMAWVAFDRAIQSVEKFGLDGPIDKWKKIRQQIHDQVCEKGFDKERGTFTQYYGSKSLDSACLMIPLVGFLPPKDQRIKGTVDAIQRELCKDGFLLRYSVSSAEVQQVDPLPGQEGTFLPCSFWLADVLALIGRKKESETMFKKLLSLTNDLGLISEEYDTINNRLIGNFPQAFTHISLINTAMGLSPHHRGASDSRSQN